MLKAGVAKIGSMTNVTFDSIVAAECERSS